MFVYVFYCCGGDVEVVFFDLVVRGDCLVDCFY